MREVSHDFRIDGNYLIRMVCDDCKELFSVHAMSPVRFDGTHGLCPACEQVYLWEHPPTPLRITEVPNPPKRKFWEGFWPKNWL